MNTMHNDIGMVNTNPLPPSSESLFIHKNIPIIIPIIVNSISNFNLVTIGFVFLIVKLKLNQLIIPQY